MADKKLLEELADVPLAQPGFDALGLAAPLIVHGNAQGKWQAGQPQALDEKQLKEVVEHLVSSNAITSNATYCHQCALQNKNAGVCSSYVPVVMMPLTTPPGICPAQMLPEEPQPAETEAAKADNESKAESKAETKSKK